MKCPICGGDTTVIDSRPKVDSVGRRRKCLKCSYRFSTLEIEAERYTTKKKIDTELENFKRVLYAALEL